MISKIANLVKNYITSAFSGYTSIILAAGCGILFTYLVTLNTTISSQKKQIKEITDSLGNCSQKIVNERDRANNQVNTEILESNNKTLTEENRRLLESNKKLSELNKSKEKDNEKVSNELSKLKNKECLQVIVDDETVDSLNEIFNE